MVTRFCSSPKKRRVSRAGRHERNRTTLATRSRAAGDAVTTFVYHRACHVRSRLEMRANGGVNRAARIHESLAGSRMMRETLPPLRFNDLFAGVGQVSARVHQSSTRKVQCKLSSNVRETIPPSPLFRQILDRALWP
jgi:hypothetical protein